MITKITSLAVVALVGMVASGGAFAGNSTTGGAQFYKAAYVYGLKDKAQRANHWRGNENNNPISDIERSK